MLRIQHRGVAEREKESEESEERKYPSRRTRSSATSSALHFQIEASSSVSASPMAQRRLDIAIFFVGIEDRAVNKE